MLMGKEKPARPKARGQAIQGRMLFVAWKQLYRSPLDDGVECAWTNRRVAQISDHIGQRTATSGRILSDRWMGGHNC